MKFREHSRLQVSHAEVADQQVAFERCMSADNIHWIRLAHAPYKSLSLQQNQERICFSLVSGDGSTFGGTPPGQPVSHGSDALGVSAGLASPVPWLCIPGRCGKGFAGRVPPDTCRWSRPIGLTKGGCALGRSGTCGAGQRPLTVDLRRPSVGPVPSQSF
jgi:hypothetical protein